MDIRRIKYFLSLAETGNYTETAERMYTSQGNVSKQIQAMEKELDTLLFDRSRRRIRLTETGEMLLPYARQIVQLYDEMEESVHSMSSAEELILRIHAIPVGASYQIPKILSGFRKAHPEVQVHFKEMEKAYLNDNLEEGLCDMIFTRSFPEEEVQYDKCPIARDRFVAVMSREHPLSGKTLIRLEELAGSPFLLLDEKTGLLGQVTDLCQEAGFTPKIAYKGVRIDTILGMVENNLGVSILMEGSVSKDSVAKIPLAVTRESELAFLRVRKRKHSKAGKQFWQFLRQYSISE